MKNHVSLFEKFEETFDAFIRESAENELEQKTVKDPIKKKKLFKKTQNIPDNGLKQAIDNRHKPEQAPAGRVTRKARK